MRVLLLPFYLVILLASNIFTLSTLLIGKLRSHRSLIVSSLILFIFFFMFVFTSPSPSDSKKTTPRSALLSQKKELENLLTKQPTHRDILLNLAEVNRVLGNHQSALDLKNKALQIDPNFNL